jgi:streptogramin lyase
VSTTLTDPPRARPDPVDTSIRRTPKAGPPVDRRWTVLAACASALAGGIHLGSAGAHGDVWPLEGVAFVLVGLLQAGIGGWLILGRPGRVAINALWTVHLAAAAAWTVTRTFGWPVGPFQGVVEAAALADVAATVSALVALYALRRRDTARLPRGRRLIGAGAVVGIVALSAPAVAVVPFLAHDAESHGHGPDLAPDTFPDGRDLRRQADDPTDGVGFAVGRAPVDIAFGHGFLWVVNGRDGSVTRMTSDGEVVGTVPVGDGTTSVAVGPSAVWVTSIDGFLSRLDPGSGQVTGRVEVGRLARGIDVADDGTVYVTSAGDGSLSRVDPDSLTATSALLLPDILPAFNGPGPSALAVDGDVVWVLNTLRRELARYDATTLEPLGPGVRTGAGAAGLLLQGDLVWVAATTAGTVWRHDRATGQAVGDPIVVDELPQFGGGPAALASAFGSIWVLNNDDRTVSRIDPVAGRVVGEPLFLDNFHAEVPRGAGIVGTGDAVWATDYDGDRVVRLDVAGG